MEGGGPSGVKEAAEEGGGPAGVVDGFEARESEKPNLLPRRSFEPGVEGLLGLEENGIWKVDMASRLMEVEVREDRGV